MVVGKTSSFVEGFKSFTTDDELMLANLKQALNYSADNLAIPDANLNLSSNKNIMPTKNSSMGSTMPTMDSTMPTMDSTMPTMDSTMPTMSYSMPTMGSTMPTMGSTMPTMGSTMPTMSYSMPTMGSTMQTKGSTMPTMNSGMNSTMPTMNSSISSTMPTKGSSMPTKSSTMKNKPQESIRDIKRVRDHSYLDNENDTDEEDENAVLDEEDYTNKFEEEEAEKEAKKEDKERELQLKYSKTRRQHQEKIEGFQGSIEIESRNLKNILLALLLSFVGYLVVYASMNNYIPIAEISPQLKKFKHLIYGGVFFVIAYICLEVF